MLLNRTKEKVSRGEVTYGTIHGFPTPDVVRFFANVGYDWLFIDAEHDPVSPETVTRLVEACHLHGMTPFVRVPDNTPGTILRYLEAGAMGIIVPHLNNAEEARALVASVRYGPKGRRGAGSTSRVANFGLTQTPAEYFARADAEIWTWGVIEEERGLKNLDEILAVEGLDLLGIGPGDLSISLGMRGQAWAPQVRAMVDDAEERIARSDKILWSLVRNAEDNAVAVARGAKVILTNAIPIMHAAAAGYVRGLRDAEGRPDGKRAPGAVAIDR